jgi:hypothetical protein
MDMVRMSLQQQHDDAMFDFRAGKPQIMSRFRFM